MQKVSQNINKIVQKLSLLILLNLFASFIFAQDWVEKESLPNDTERHHAITFALDGYGYLTTGETNSAYFSNDFYKYDPGTDEWEQLPDFPGPGRAFGYGVAYGGKAYIGFGDKFETSNLEFLNDLWEYDPATEQWKELARCPCAGRDHPALIAAGGIVFVGLGNNSNGNMKDWWGYNIELDAWKQYDDLPGFERHHPYYFDINDMAYVGFGHGSQGTPRIYNDFYRFDPITEQWTKLNDFPGEGRVAGTQFSNAGKGYILSGQGDDHDHLETGEFWEYDPDSDTWRELPVHPGGGRWAPASFVLEDQVYLTTGEIFTGLLMNDLWAFDLRSVTSIDENESELLTHEIELFPNPTDDFLTVKTEKGIQFESFEIQNATGKIVLAADFENNQIDVSELPSGIYFLNLVSKENKRTVVSFSKN